MCLGSICLRFAVHVSCCISAAIVYIAGVQNKLNVNKVILWEKSFNNNNNNYNKSYIFLKDRQC